MWIVMTSAANMPSSCWGRYRNVALVQLTQYATANGLRPARIDDRDRSILRIAGKHHYNVGKTARCAYARAVAAAQAEADRRNNLMAHQDYSAWGGSA